MSLRVKTNQLTGPATATTSPTTDPGFTPKALFVWNGLQTAAGAAVDAQWNLGIASSTTTERAGGWNSDDAALTSDVVRMFSNTRLSTILTAGTTTANNVYDLSSFDATGFTTNWTTVNTASTIYNYLALGGTDITNVLSSSFAASTSTGNQAVTGVGFQPDIVFFFFNIQTAAGQTNGNTAYGMGTATSSSARWAVAVSSQNAQATTNTQRAFYNNSCIVTLLPASAGIDGQADFVSMDSDGFTINWSDAPAAAGLVGYMAIKGGRWKVGTDTQKTSTGTKPTTGVGFRPEALIFASHCDTTTNSIAAHARLMFGATTGASNNVAQWVGDQDASIGLAIADTIMSNSKALVMATEGTPTTDAEAALTSFDGDGFTLDWTTADANARVFGYIAIRSNTVQTGNFLSFM